MNFENQSTFKSFRGLSTILWLVSALLASLLFYQQTIGLNLVIAGLAVTGLYFLTGQVSGRASFMTICAVFISLSSAYRGSFASLVLLFFVLFTLMGFSRSSLRQHLFAGLAGFGNWFIAPAARLFLKKSNPQPGKVARHKVGRMWIIPTFLLVGFAILYVNGNFFFQEWWIGIWEFASAEVRRFLSSLEWGAIGFFLVMLLVMAGFIFWVETKEVIRIEKETPLKIKRSSGKISLLEHLLFGMGIVPRRKITGLTYELKMAILILISLNVLLFANNLSDVWSLLATDQIEPSVLYKHVHQGTLNLTISLVCSSVLILYFFRGNLNFLKGNTNLVLLSKFWLLQNGLLVLLIAVRNWQYVDHFGLTYKRLGVYYFLVLMSIGLAMVWRKIDHKDSTFSILKRSVYAIFLSLIVLAPINWDRIIARYNLGGHQVGTGDVEYVMNLSYEVIPVLIEHEPRLRLQTVMSHEYLPVSYKQGLEEKIHNYQQDRKNERLVGMDYCEWQIKEAIKQYQGY